MAIKNYYVVLGVHQEVSDAGIRSAYKDLAKKFHPDRIGEHSTEAFQAISEAYQTLSDPEKRRSSPLARPVTASRRFYFFFLWIRWIERRKRRFESVLFLLGEVRSPGIRR